MIPEWMSEEHLVDPDSPFNLQKLFYLMYVANQIGNYFASDDEDGNTTDPIGWLQGFPGFPTQLWNGDSEEHVSAQDSAGLGGLYDNDGCDCDDDGDLSTIAAWGYGSSFRVTPGVINLFRETVDNVPPVTTAEKTRLDGNPMSFWNNSPVMVHLTGAIDYGKPDFRPSGVWKVWGRVDGVTPANVDDPSWNISDDGIHRIEYMSTDWCGNVENTDQVVRIDMSLPEITFPDIKPLYLTSEDFMASWVATDALSGLSSEYALLDGETVTKGQVIDLSPLAGVHRLEVYAYDQANNYQYAYYDFEVGIDADGWCLPALVNEKTKGKAMFCVVEFPWPYDVRLIDYTTCTLKVNGVAIPADLITGVGDHDGDGNPDRKLRLNKEQFVAALTGQVGNIQAEIWGGSLPNGMPRFVADVTVPVFSPPKK
jgi:hypothetical protein